MNRKELIEAERVKYYEAWKHPQYREESPAYRVREEIIKALDLSWPPRDADRFFTPSELRTLPAQRRVIDFGCGSGQFSGYMVYRGFHVTGVDIAANSVDQKLFDGINIGNFVFWNCALHEMRLPPNTRKWEAGWCVDVMEHVPEELVDATLNAISDVCEKVYFRIALFPDHWGESVGIGNLHPTVKPWQWWVSVIADYFSIQKSWCEDDPHHGGRVLVVIAT